MRIFLKIDELRHKEITWRRKFPMAGTSSGEEKEIRKFIGGEISKNLRGLKFENIPNVVGNLVIIARIGMDFMGDFLYRAILDKEGRIEIICVVRKQKEVESIKIMEIDGNAEPSEDIKENIINSCINSVREMPIAEKARKKYLERLKERMEQIISNRQFG